MLSEMIRPNDPGLVICPVAALTRPAGDSDRIQVANRVRKIHLIESIKELRAELDVLPLPNVELLTDAEVDIGLSRPAQDVAAVNRRIFLTASSMSKSWHFAILVDLSELKNTPYGCNGLSPRGSKVKISGKVDAKIGYVCRA